MATQTRYAGSGVNSDADGTTAWLNPANAEGDTTGTAATCAPATNGHISQQLRLSSYGFEIPDGSTINGILVEQERQASNNNRFFDHTVQLMIGGSPTGQNKSAGATYSNSKGNANFGGAADLWELTPTVAQINASGFGVMFKGVRTATGTVTASVFRVAITVDYDPPSVAEPQEVIAPSADVVTQPDAPVLRVAQVVASTVAELITEPFAALLRSDQAIRATLAEVVTDAPLPSLEAGTPALSFTAGSNVVQAEVLAQAQDLIAPRVDVVVFPLAPRLVSDQALSAEVAEVVTQALAPAFRREQVVRADAANVVLEPLMPIMETGQPALELVAPTVELISEAPTPALRLQQSISAPAAEVVTEPGAPSLRVQQALVAPIAEIVIDAPLPTFELVAEAQELTAVAALIAVEALVPRFAQQASLRAPTAELVTEAPVPALSIGLKVRAGVAEVVTEAMAPTLISGEPFVSVISLEGKRLTTVSLIGSSRATAALTGAQQTTVTLKGSRRSAVGLTGKRASVLELEGSKQ
jgi:hypothetical protein